MHRPIVLCIEAPFRPRHCLVQSRMDLLWSHFYVGLSMSLAGGTKLPGGEEGNTGESKDGGGVVTFASQAMQVSIRKAFRAKFAAKCPGVCIQS